MEKQYSKGSCPNFKTSASSHVKKYFQNMQGLFRSLEVSNLSLINNMLPADQLRKLVSKLPKDRGFVCKLPWQLLCCDTHTHIYIYVCVCVYIYIYLKATLFYVFLNWNCGCILNLRRYFSLFKKSWKHYFPQRTRIVNFTDSELYLLAKIVHSHNKFLNAKRLMLYHTIHTKHNLLSENHP